MQLSRQSVTLWLERLIVQDSLSLTGDDNCNIVLTVTNNGYIHVFVWVVTYLLLYMCLHAECIIAMENALEVLMSLGQLCLLSVHDTTS